MECNPDYWNEGLPYLDDIEFYHFEPFSPPLGAALFAGRIDYARLLDQVSRKKLETTPGMSGTSYYQSAIQAVWVNNTKKPFDDPRVRRAMHLAFDRPALVDVVKDIAPMLVGGFIYPFSDWATPLPQLSERLGYQADPTATLQEAHQLLAAAGHAQELKRTWSGRLRRSLNRTRPYSRCPGRRSMTAGSTTSRVTIRTTTLASTTSYALIPSGWISRGRARCSYVNGCASRGVYKELLFVPRRSRQHRRWVSLAGWPIGPTAVSRRWPRGMRQGLRCSSVGAIRGHRQHVSTTSK